MVPIVNFNFARSILTAKLAKKKIAKVAGKKQAMKM
jgi:hypothetical protein